MTLSVRRARTNDVPSIHQLLDYYAARGQLLPRSLDELTEHISSFTVINEADNLTGCAALEVFTEDLGEVRSLAVSDTATGGGYGRALVEEIEHNARTIGLRRLMALTYVPDFFARLGYGVVAMDTLPEKVFGVCVTCPKFRACDEIAVLKHLD
jgi:amino-acid N-acetyltransferase